MTYSDCWIDTVDDEEFRAFITERASIDTPRVEKIFMLPPPPQPYWINTVLDWAKAQGLPIGYSDGRTLAKVAVSRTQLLDFLDSTLGRESVPRLRAHVRDRLRDDRTYLIVADEF